VRQKPTAPARLR